MICREYKKINELFNQVNDVAGEMCRGERGGDTTAPYRASHCGSREARGETGRANAAWMEKGFLFALMLLFLLLLLPNSPSPPAQCRAVMAWQRERGRRLTRGAMGAPTGASFPRALKMTSC